MLGDSKISHCHQHVAACSLLLWLAVDDIAGTYTSIASTMTSLPVYELQKIDRALDTDATAVRHQTISKTGFSYPGDVPSSETNYTFYAVKESDRKLILIGTGDIVVSRNGTFFYIAVSNLACSGVHANICQSEARTLASFIMFRSWHVVVEGVANIVSRVCSIQ